MTQERAKGNVVGDNSGDSDVVKSKHRDILQEILGIVESRISETRGQIQFDQVTNHKKAVIYENGKLEAYVDVATLLASWKEQI